MKKGKYFMYRVYVYLWNYLCLDRPITVIVKYKIYKESEKTFKMKLNCI